MSTHSISNSASIEMTNYYSNPANNNQNDTVIDIIDTRRLLSKIYKETLQTGSHCPEAKTEPSEPLDIDKIFKKNYLPKYPKYLKQLIYLCSIDGTDKKSPFTKEQTDVFERSKRVHNITAFWLKWGVVVFAGLAAPSFINYVSGTSLGLTAQAGIISTVGLLQTFSNSMAGLVITGTNPHEASDRANDKQNHWHLLEKNYDELAYHIIDLHFEFPALAAIIASNIQLDKLRTSIRTNIDNKHAEVLITESLEESINYVLYNKMPYKKHLLKGHVQTRIMLAAKAENNSTKNN